MRTFTGTILGILIGIGLTLTLVPVMAQDSRIPGVRGVNHVGLSVDNFEESVAFYTQKLEIGRAHV